MTITNATWAAIRHRFNSDECEAMSFAQTGETEDAFVLDAGKLTASLRIKIERSAAIEQALRGVANAK